MGSYASVPELQACIHLRASAMHLASSMPADDLYGEFGDKADVATTGVRRRFSTTTAVHLDRVVHFGCRWAPRRQTLPALTRWKQQSSSER